VRRAPGLLLLVLASVLGGGCGDHAADDGHPAHGPGAGAFVKPRSGVGSLEARVVERPAADRAVVEVSWRLAPETSDALLEAVCPEGAWLVEGALRRRLEPGLLAGTLRWTVGFEAGRTLDLALRLGARTARGRRSAETYVRLASVR
jgi:hypothetical protein